MTRHANTEPVGPPASHAQAQSINDRGGRLRGNPIRKWIRRARRESIITNPLSLLPSLSRFRPLENTGKDRTVGGEGVFEGGGGSK